MPDKKLTDNEIKNELQSAIEWFTEHGRNTNTAIIGICERALDLINRKNAECKECGSRTSESIEKLQKQIAEKNAENEQLTKDKESLAYSLANAVGQKMTAKAEAYKEFADLSIKKICEQVTAPTPSESYIVEKCNQVIYNLLKELTNEQPPNDVKCIDCEYLEINGAWGVCAEAHKMVHPDDCCGKGKLKGDENA